METFERKVNNSESIIEIRNLTKDYQTLKALNNVTLSIAPGRIIGLLGPNGSGKTTLIKILAGLNNNYSGEVLINGYTPGVETKKIVAYLPDKNVVDGNWTVKDCINFYDDFYDDFDSTKASVLVDKLRINKQQRFRTLSKGTKDKVQLILTLSRNAKIYIFDEPIAGVDPAAREFIFKLILDNYNRDATIIISTHLVVDAEAILDDIIFLYNGEVKLYSEKQKLYDYYHKTIDELFREVYKC